MTLRRVLITGLGAGLIAGGVTGGVLLTRPSQLVTRPYPGDVHYGPYRGHATTVPEVVPLPPLPR